MANEQDIRLASQKCRDALQKHDLDGAKAALTELRDLAQVFDDMQGQLSEPDQVERTRELKERAESEVEGFKSKVSELQIDMADPRFEERLRSREQEKSAREAADKAKAAQMLQGLGGPFAALAGLANLGGPTPAPTDEVKCPACATPNPKRANFCMECGKPMARRCSACSADLGKAKFCPECGAKAT